MPLAVVYRELAQNVVLHNYVRTYIGCLLGFWQFYNATSPTFHCSFFMSGVKIINFRVMCMFEPLQSFLLPDMQSLLIFRGFDSLEVYCGRLTFHFNRSLCLRCLYDTLPSLQGCLQLDYIHMHEIICSIINVHGIIR